MTTTTTTTIFLGCDSIEINLVLETKNKKAQYVVNAKTGLLFVIEGFFQFQGYDYLSQLLWNTL